MRLELILPPSHRDVRAVLACILYCDRESSKMPMARNNKSSATLDG
jgi:hypothetical protein